MVHQKLLIHSNNPENSLEVFNRAMNQLQEQKLIRHKPQKVRETFKIVN